MENLQAQVDELKNKLAACKAPGPLFRAHILQAGQNQGGGRGPQNRGQAASDIKALPQPEVAVEGHADKTPMNPRGRRKFGDNLGISVVRSLSVARELFARGVDVERVVVIGYGDSRPLKPEPNGHKSQ